MAILPFFLGFLAQNNAFLLRIFRVLRLLRLSRLGRFSRACSALAEALNARIHELLLSIGVAGLLLLFSSACLYAVEAADQPEAFGSVPRALWWSIATLTTVGYGDVTPITALGSSSPASPPSRASALSPCPPAYWPPPSATPSRTSHETRSTADRRPRFGAAWLVYFL